MLRTLFTTVQGALVWGVLGFVLVFTLPPDPIGYIGLACMVVAVLVGIVAVVRSPRPTTILLALVAAVPLALFAWALSGYSRTGGAEARPRSQARRSLVFGVSGTRASRG